MTRREFLGTGAGAPAAQGLKAAREEAWYRRALRWGQTNITEKDPPRYDIGWWRGYWKRTRVQGVIINAGGIVAYYPSKYPLQYRARFLEGRDLYGELCRAAHEDGLAVLARMDSNRASEEFYRAHPDWFARDANGKVYRAADRYVACINSPYYDEYLPGVLREIIGRSHPEGVTDNSWSGLGRDRICYCDNCARRFGRPLPKRVDWDDPTYREWIEWGYARRLEIWDANNRVTRAAGGPDCLWIGMNGGTVTGQAYALRDYREICRRAEIIMLDHQARGEGGFPQNAEAGKLIHGLLGWDKAIPESMAMYQAGRDIFRLAAKPAAEARMWMVAGFAGGIQPWWHHVGAVQEDRRGFRTAGPVMRWHEANQAYLVRRRPVAAAGVVWSQRNTDYYGRDDPERLVDAPWRGMIQALVRARIPYVPVHADDIDRDAGELTVLVLPELAAISDAQAAAVRRFVERGGGLVATGASTLYTETGEPRGDFALADLFGAHGRAAPDQRKRAAAHEHTYLRIERRHAVLRGFEETDILAFGGLLGELKTDPDAVVPLTFIPPLPVFPPESVWMRTGRTAIPGLVLKGRVAYLVADLDRRFARDNLPDHGDLLENLVRWAARDRVPLEVEGPGLIDCHLYRQPGRLILHVVSATALRPPIEEAITLGPFRVRVKLPQDVGGGSVELRVSGAKPPIAVENGWAVFEIPRLLDHELAIVAHA